MNKSDYVSDSVYKLNEPMGQFYYSSGMLYQTNGQNCIFMKWIIKE